MATFAHDALRIFTSCKPPLVAHRIAKSESYRQPQFDTIELNV